MSQSFRDRADRATFGDCFRDKNSDEEFFRSLRDHLDQDQRMRFDSAPTWGESASSTKSSPFTRTGFPFEDSEDRRFSRSSRLQRHLDDIINRHPQFAQHLRPSDMAGRFRMFGGRNRHGSGGSSGIFFSEDETSDNPSQASGGSEENPSSGVLQEEEEFKSSPNKLPQYGLRNTVDLGGAAQKLEASERNQRSWSAPPDGRSEAQPKRFISRIEIQPTISNAEQPQASPPQSSGKPPVAPKQSTSGSNPSKPASNVRHIPIFVEGRDEPVLPKDNLDTSSSANVTSQDEQPGQSELPDPQHHFTSDFPRYSGFRDFTDSPFADRFTRLPFSRFGPQPFGSASQGFHRVSPDFQQHRPQPAPQKPYSQPRHPQEHPASHPASQQQPPPQQKRPVPPQAPPSGQTKEPPTSSMPPQPPQPPPANDPLFKVAVVQKDVDALTEQVNQFLGNSRTDKQYIYLDEMLTRNLLRLDDIETQGKEDIRQARKNTIRSIQRAISLLESKAPSPAKTGDVDVGAESSLDCETNQGTEVDCEEEKSANLASEIPVLEATPESQDATVAQIEEKLPGSAQETDTNAAPTAQEEQNAPVNSENLESPPA